MPHSTQTRTRGFGGSLFPRRRFNRDMNPPKVRPTFVETLDELERFKVGARRESAGGTYDFGTFRSARPYWAAIQASRSLLRNRHSSPQRTAGSTHVIATRRNCASHRRRSITWSLVSNPV